MIICLENDVKVLIPTAKEQKEMHQVFAKCSRSSFVWTCKTCGEVSLVIEECPYISKEEQASFNDEVTCKGSVFFRQIKVCL